MRVFGFFGDVNLLGILLDCFHFWGLLVNTVFVVLPIIFPLNLAFCFYSVVFVGKIAFDCTFMLNLLLFQSFFFDVFPYNSGICG
jgi:hypothetical protein